MGEKLKTTLETADELSVDPEQVRRLVKDGELHPINVGRGKKRDCLRFEDADIEAFKLRRKGKSITCPPSTKRARSRNSTTRTSGSTVLNFLAQQRKRASEKQAAKLMKSKRD